MNIVLLRVELNNVLFGDSEFRTHAFDRSVGDLLEQEFREHCTSDF